MIASPYHIEACYLLVTFLFMLYVGVLFWIADKAHPKYGFPIMLLGLSLPCIVLGILLY